MILFDWICADFCWAFADNQFGITCLDQMFFQILLKYTKFVVVTSAELFLNFYFVNLIMSNAAELDRNESPRHLLITGLIFFFLIGTI